MEKYDLNIDEIVKKIDSDRDYTVKEISEIFPISYSAITGSIKRERLPSRKVFNKFYVKGRHLRSFLLGEKILA